MFKKPVAEKDHGYDLADEFEDFITHFGERVTNRAAVVRSRLADLEDEMKHLVGLSDKIDKHQQ